MKKLLFLISISVSCLISFHLYAGMDSGDLIQLSEPDDVKDAKMMNSAIDLLSNKVMECVEKKLAPAQDCHCLYPDVLSEVRKVYDDILDKHSGWRDKSIFWWRDENKDYSYNISFYGLRHQFEQSCK